MKLAQLPLELERRTYTALRRLADRRSKQPPHLLTGERGEDAAFFHLRSIGYTIVARRWRSERIRGDLDLVGWDGDTLVIFEVKTRTAASAAEAFAPAEVDVDRAKQRMLRRMTAAYLRQLPEQHRERVPVRFDILSVYINPVTNALVFDHMRAAFSYSY